MKDRKNPWILRPDIIFVFVVLVIEFFYFKDVHSRSKGYDGVFITGLFVLSVVCFLWMLLAIRKHYKKVENTEGGAGKEKTIAEHYKTLMTRRQFVFAVSALAYVILINVLGFLFATVIFLAFIIRYLGETNMVRLAVIAVLLPLGLDLLFTKVFMIPLPTGMINMGIGAWLL